MTKLSLLHILFLSLIPATIVFSQSVNSVEFNNMLYPSNLRAVQKAQIQNIELSWTPSAYASKYRLYRANREISTELLPFLEIRAELPGTANSYIDEVPGNGSYYYAILSLSSNGIVLRNLVSNENKTTTAVVVSTLVAHTEFKKIRALKAEVVGANIMLSFEAPDAGQFSVFRSFDKITNTNDLLEAELIATINPGVKTYLDSVYADIPYYYAIIDKNAVGLGFTNLSLADTNNLVVIGLNSLREAVIVPREDSTVAQSSATRRNPPLFTSQLPSETPDNSQGQKLPDQLAIKVQQVLNRYSASKIPILPTKEIFSRDRQLHSSNAIEVEFLQIVSNSFANSRYRDSEEQLQKFLEKTLPADIEFRARFYYAQSLFFNNKTTQALQEFVQIRSVNPQIISPWITAILNG